MVKNIGKFRNKYWLKNKYLKANLSQGEIASLCNVSGSTIGKYTKKFNLKKSKSDIVKNRQKTNLKLYGCLGTKAKKKRPKKSKLVFLRHWFAHGYDTMVLKSQWQNK